ncbi:MAG: hypothetical protein J2P52_00670 [Blastocatellia bacterium]|nr:hypothetical protein [Blastocatellia bacterium]
MLKSHFLSSLVIFVAGFALSAIVDGRRLASMTQGNLYNSGAGSAAPEVAAQITRQPSTSQKWEYRVVTRYIQRNQADIDFELNRLGEQGYEICGVAQSGAGLDGLFLTVTFRRPKV